MEKYNLSVGKISFNRHGEISTERNNVEKSEITRKMKNFLENIRFVHIYKKSVSNNGISLQHKKNSYLKMKTNYVFHKVFNTPVENC